MIDLKSATEGLTNEEIRQYVNQATTRFFASTLKGDKDSSKDRG